jgi:hypothetical protein
MDCSLKIVNTHTNNIVASYPILNFIFLIFLTKIDLHWKLQVSLVSGILMIQIIFIVDKINVF